MMIRVFIALLLVFLFGHRMGLANIIIIITNSGRGYNTGEL